MASSHQSSLKTPGVWFERCRLVLIGGLCLLSVGAIAKLNFSKTVALESQTFDYPEQVTLSSWQFVDSEVARTKNKLPGRRYTFQRENLTATITVHYQPSSDGNVSRLLVAYTEAKPATVYIHSLKHPKTGYLGAFIFQNHAYISACINPHGISTITEQQFVQNQYFHSLNLLPWLMGQRELTDSSCLWTLISAPIAPDATPNKITQTFKQLETAWVEWYQWWRHDRIREGATSAFKRDDYQPK